MATEPPAAAAALTRTDLVWATQRSPGRSVLAASYPGGLAVMAVAGDDALTGAILWSVSALDPATGTEQPYDLGLVPDLAQAEEAVLAAINSALER